MFEDSSSQFKALKARIRDLCGAIDRTTFSAVMCLPSEDADGQKVVLDEEQRTRECKNRIANDADLFREIANIQVVDTGAATFLASIGAAGYSEMTEILTRLCRSEAKRVALEFRTESDKLLADYGGMQAMLSDAQRKYEGLRRALESTHVAYRPEKMAMGSSTSHMMAIQKAAVSEYESIRGKVDVAYSKRAELIKAQQRLNSECVSMPEDLDAAGIHAHLPLTKDSRDDIDILDIVKQIKSLEGLIHSYYSSSMVKQNKSVSNRPSKISQFGNGKGEEFSAIINDMMADEIESYSAIAPV